MSPAAIRSAHMHPFEWSPWHPWFCWLPRKTLDNTWVWGWCERAIRSVECGPWSGLQTCYRKASARAPARPRRRLYLEQAYWFERMGNEPARVASLRAAERCA